MRKVLSVDFPGFVVNPFALDVIELSKVDAGRAL